MNINIYYGGRGLIDDPTLCVIHKMQQVLTELRVNVRQFNLYEHKNMITTLPETLKEADGIILATTIEWYGIGGYMQQFLDSCWLYGDKEKIGKIYMCPVVMSTTYGEREGKINLSTAWEILGGKPCSGICGYIADTVELEMNKEYSHIIEKKAENMYRVINQKVASFPASNQAVRQMVSTTQNIDLTPQETEQLSRYVADDSYVKRQKEDIQELTNLFRDMMGEGESEIAEEFIKELKESFKPIPGVEAEYLIKLEQKNICISVKNAELECYYGTIAKPDVEIQISRDEMNEIICGRLSFQRAFMSGIIKLKGDFKILRTLDQIFVFKESL